MQNLGTRSWSATEQFTEGDLVYVEAKVFDKSEKEKYSDFFANKGKTILKGEIISISKITKKARVKFEIDGTTSNLNCDLLLKELSEDQQRFLYTGALNDDGQVEGPSRVMNFSNVHGDDLEDLFSSTSSSSSPSSSSEDDSAKFEMNKGIEAVREQNILQNNKQLAKLGIEVSKRKFNRHVPNYDNFEYVSDSDCSGNEADESSRNECQANTKTEWKALVDGEEVYLVHETDEIFKAKYQETTPGTLVHGKPIQAGEGRFFIIKVLRKAGNWEGFDIDITCEGSAILWNTSNIKRIQMKSIEKAGTEAKHPTVTPGKKRKRNPDKWVRNRCKVARLSGEDFEFEYKKKGCKHVKTIKKKTMKGPCNCSKKCHEVFTEEIRQKIFDDFYASANHQAQNAQIIALVRQTKKQRERKRDKPKKRSREFVRVYHLQINDEQVQCCSVMFLNTLNISEKRVRTVLKNKTTTGTPKPDGRGRHFNHRTCEAEEACVIDHIKQFEVLESHYVRKETQYEYLPTDLTIAAMHRMYNEWRQTKSYPEVTYSFYARIFNERFNLKFQTLKKDRCDTCESYNNHKPEELTEEMKADQQKHLKEKNMVRQIKEDCKTAAKTDKELVVAAFDLQKVLLSPFGQVSSFYYSRRLTNHNLTVTDITSMETSCFFWTEAECQKGSCEVATSILKFLEAKSESGVKRFQLFCDRCGGQNNNRMIFIMLSYAIKTFHIESITLTYLVSGHSYSENDAAHSMIERMVRNKTIYTQAEWEVVIQCSFQTNPCIFKVLEHSDIINFKNPKAFPEYHEVLNDKTEEIMTEEARKKQKEYNEKIGMPKRKATKVFWSEIVCLKFLYENPETMYFKYQYDESYRTAKFSNTPVNLRNNQSEKVKEKEMRKYMKPCGIPERKKQDLLELCKKKLIPLRHHNYFENLPVNKSKKDDAGKAKPEKKKTK